MARSGRLYRQTYQFRHVGEFGISKSVESPITGISSPRFSKLFTLHYARRNQTISDRYQAAGTTYEDTTIIVIRHNRDLAAQDVVYVKIDGKLYKCISYSVNDDTYNAMDLLTLKHVKKVS